jgi:competence protein ComEA
MSIQKFIKDYLSFGKKDRAGMIALVVLILAIYFLPLVFSPEPEPFPIRKGSLLASAIDSLDARDSGKDSSILAEPVTGKTKPLSGALFPFDPNLIPAEDWLKLGLKPRTVKTILNYRNKGGRFYKPEDLERIWGLPPGFYERVKPYVVIAPLPGKTPKDAPSWIAKEKVLQQVPVNEADTTAFIALPGIGTKLATRIISFREKLGGFYSVDQVGETYGLSDSSFQKIRPYLVNAGAVRLMDLNAVTAEELKDHPYFRWTLARAIVAYRNQHGPFKDLSELKNISLIDDVTYERIVHYLQLNH